mmetsp:Transcript_7478/g.22705  ORF Transcript_7478/g.22705 Transcript_7478/m.22705 type:complete len:206 (-) Transcript_7478:1146-1763(-)
MVVPVCILRTRDLQSRREARAPKSSVQRTIWNAVVVVLDCARWRFTSLMISAYCGSSKTLADTIGMIRDRAFAAKRSTGPRILLVLQASTKRSIPPFHESSSCSSSVSLCGVAFSTLLSMSENSYLLLYKYALRNLEKNLLQGWSGMSTILPIAMASRVTVASPSLSDAFTSTLKSVSFVWSTAAPFTTMLRSDDSRAAVARISS